MEHKLEDTWTMSALKYCKYMIMCLSFTTLLVLYFIDVEFHNTELSILKNYAVHCH